jgi:lauroyl/myristoyl acyltransferase
MTEIRQELPRPRPRVYQAAAWLSRSLPLPFAYWLGLRIADVYHVFDPRGRAAVSSHIRRILRHRGLEPTRAVLRRETRETYRHFGKYLVDFFRFSQADHALIERLVRIPDLERFEAEFHRNRGVILTTAHLGNWEIGGLVLAQRGYPLTAVFRPFGIPHLDRLFTEQRENRGVRLVPLGASVKPMLHALRAGGCVALLADRDFSGQAARHPFFGAPARLPDGAARLSWRTGSPIVPGYVIRRENDSFELILDAPIRPEDHPSAASIQHAVAHSMEKAIGAHPHQWFVFADFWA